MKIVLLTSRLVFFILVLTNLYLVIIGEDGISKFQYLFLVVFTVISALVNCAGIVCAKELK